MTNNATMFLFNAGKKPETSSNVMIGILYASQVRMKRAALSEESISKPPASTFGWLQTSPTDSPAIRAKPTTTFSQTLRELP